MTRSRHRVVVLGAGFIGMNFVRHELRYGNTLTVLDHKPVPNDLAGQLEWLEGDLSVDADIERVLGRGADTVFHLISSTVPGDKVDITSELQHNVFQMLKLLKLCVVKKVRRIVFVSSASAYGLQKNFPIVETAPTNPISAHGIQKLTIEKYLQLFRYEYGLDCKIMRLSNPYGPGQRTTGRQGFIAIAIGRILANEQIIIRGDGEDIRDFIYIDDVSDALHRAATTDSSETIFNVGSGIGYTLNDVLKLMRSITGLPLPVVYENRRVSDIPKSILDTSRARSGLCVRQATPMQDGLVKTLKFHGIRCRNE